MLENVIIELHDGEIEVKWSFDADAMCADIRSFSTKLGVLGGPTYCKSCEMLPECPLNKYRTTIEKVQNDLQRDYNAGFDPPHKALYHLDKALFYLLIATTEDYKAWKEKELMKFISRRLSNLIANDLYRLALQSPGSQFVNNSTISNTREYNGD